MANLRPNTNKISTKGFSSGANPSVGRERLGSSEKEFYYNLQNGRPSSLTGQYTDIEKIKGEIAAFADYEADLSPGYVCIGMTNCNDHVLKFYASNIPGEYASIVIDGVLSCQSVNLPLTYDNHLQIDVNENCLGGEVYITDGVVSPMYFNVDDLIQNQSTTKYFADFELSQYTIGTESNVNHPMFVELVEVGAGAGVPAGRVSYSFNFVDDAGNSSVLSYPTPLIWVPVYYTESATNAQYKYLKTRGGAADPSVLTNYGVKIRFRIDNRFGYTSVQIIRFSHVGGEGLDFVPIAEIIKKIPIAPDEFSVYEFTDSQATSDVPIPITITEEVGGYGNIKSARAIRYFDRRVILANIEYEDISDVTVEYTGSEPTVMFPIIENVGTKGFKDPHTDAYKRPLTEIERYGWGILFHDGEGRRFFVQPIESFKNYEMPRPRQEMTGDSLTYSTDPVVAANEDGAITETFEKLDTSVCLGRTDQAYTRTTEGDGGVAMLLHPTSIESNIIDYDSKICYEVYKTSATTETFNPKVFGPGFRSLGMGFRGLDEYPSWAKAFSLVRTKRAGRVICQGLGMYKLSEFNGTDGLTKSDDSLWFHSPDIDNGIVDSSIVDDIIANPGNYKVVLSSPLGFTSEVFSFNEDNWSLFGLDNDSQIDMLVHASIQFERTGEFKNPGDLYSWIGINDGVDKGYVAYGSWRNGTEPAVFTGNANGDTEFTLTAASWVTEEQDMKHLSITLDTVIYGDLATGTTDTNNQFNNLGDFHEPFYIVTIIQDVSVPEENIVEYIMTEHYQKIESVVGIGDGATIQSFQIVDERPEDFFVEAGDTVTDKYIWIKKNSTSEVLRYINITEKSPADIATIEFDIANNATTYNGLNLYGTYEATEEYIQFNALTTNNPDTDDEVIVKYDNTEICKVFGGDSVFGGNTFSPINRHSNSEADRETQFHLGAGFPYKSYELYSSVHIVKNADPIFGDPSIQSATQATLGLIRQMVVEYYCTSFSYSPLNHQNKYPMVNYIPRPHKWDSGADMAANGYLPEYIEAYPGEIDRWRFGGFRVRPTIINEDYSKLANNLTFTSKPLVGFNEQLKFCTRVVWSQQRSLSDNSSPSIKTFLVNSIYDLSDHNGDIVYLFDDITRGTNSLFAVCHEDIALLVTNQAIITTLGGEQLQIVGEAGSAYVNREIWTKTAGVPDELWMFIAESEKTLFMLNHSTAFMLQAGEVKDIGMATPYYAELKRTLFSNLKLPFTTKVFTSVFDREYREWIIYFSGVVSNPIVSFSGNPPTEYDYTEVPVCLSAQSNLLYINILNLPEEGYAEFYVHNSGIYDFDLRDDTTGIYFATIEQELYYKITSLDGVLTATPITQAQFEAAVGGCGLNVVRESCSHTYSELVGAWIGSFDYTFSKGTSFDMETYIEKNLSVKKINEGYLIDDSPMNFNLKVSFAPDFSLVKLFVRLKINCNVSPNRINFYDENFENIIALILQSELRDYGAGFEQYIPRMTADQNRIVGKYLNIEINHTDEEDFYLSSIDLQYRRLR